MTLDEMYVEIATYVDETITKTGAVYLDTSLAITNKFKSAINEAYRKIATERYKLIYSQTVTLDANLQFTLSGLTKTFYRLVRVEDADEYEITAMIIPAEKVECPNEASGDTVTVYYYYLPAELSVLTGSPEFPTAAVDHKVMCYYAAFKYLTIEGEQENRVKARDWLALWNEGFDSINQNRGEVDTVQNVMGW